MTSHPDALSDSTRNSTSSPLDRRTTSKLLSSSSHRYSIGNDVTAGSSSAANLRDSKAVEALNIGRDEDGFHSENLEVHKAVKDGKGSHRSHRSRTSGGFLLSASTFQPPVNDHASDGTYEIPPRQRHSTYDLKGKSALKSPERRHMKRNSGVGLGLAGSPLASHATSADSTNGQLDISGEHIEKKNRTSPRKPNSTGLDVDATQIVNLALNLSESRKNASRRTISTPLLHSVSSGFGESIAGGSLRHHLQQQRRASRNVSPKPDRGERAITASPRTGPAPIVNSSLQAAFEEEDGSYQYQFSLSTLARAEKAKNTIELMAQYRRLLHYVPPLYPEPLARPSTTSPPSTSHGSPTTAPFTSSSRPGSAVPSIVPQEMGRTYNPLQYIRNRKVRARNSRTIDGDAQGFSDIEKVSTWIDAVAQVTAINEDYTNSSHHSMPQFSKEATNAASPHSSPQSNVNKVHGLHPRPKRPRVDWIINPADMLADIFWLEQDENKKLIENRRGQNIFPQNMDHRRLITKKGEVSEVVHPSNSVIKKEDSEPDLWIDTKLPEFKSMNADDRSSEHTASRARQIKRGVRDATRIHHGHSGTVMDNRHRMRSRSRLSSDSSDSDSQRQTGRRRSGTVASQDHGTDILEKQMNEMLAKEAREKSFDVLYAPANQATRASFETQNTEISKASHSRSGSLIIKDRRNSVRNSSSGRASLEVPGANPRGSLDDILSTAPSSPQNKAARRDNEFVSNMALEFLRKDRSPSPTKRHLSRVRSKMRPFHYRNHGSEPENLRDADENILNAALLRSKEATPQSSDTVRRRSQSPTKTIVSKLTDLSDKPIRKSSSIRRGKGEEASGIRGLFKSNRNPIVKVSDFLWKKDVSPGAATSSGFSTDDSDIEDSRVGQTKSEKLASRESSAGAKLHDVVEVSPDKHKPSFLKDMPSFTQPFERRGRSTQIKADPTSSEPILSSQIRTRAERTNSSRAYLLGGAPRIDVQNASPTSSPDVSAGDQYRDPSVSGDESRRSSFSGGVKTADARLNAILGFPGKRRNRLPVTGLSSLETTNDKRLSLDGKRTWSITDRGISRQRGPMTKREISRVTALILSSGIKAKEISRRAAELQDLRRDEGGQYGGIAALAREELRPVPKSQEHRLAARILSEDIQLSTRIWHASAESFSNITIANLLARSAGLQARMMDSLTPMTMQAADDADEVSKDLVTSQTLKVKSITDKIDRMARRRRRKFRWVRRGGWVMVEWVLVGFMWFVWFMVVVMRVVLGVGKGVVGSLRWLFWL